MRQENRGIYNKFVGLIQCATAEDADKLEKIMNEQSAELARLRMTLANMTADRDALAIQFAERNMQLAQWQERCDTLTAENRAMRGVLLRCGKHLAGCNTGREGYDWNPLKQDASKCDCDLGEAITLPHTAREVERVKALEAVADRLEHHRRTALLIAKPNGLENKSGKPATYGMICYWPDGGTVDAPQGDPCFVFTLQEAHTALDKLSTPQPEKKLPTSEDVRGIMGPDNRHYRKYNFKEGQ